MAHPIAIFAIIHLWIINYTHINTQCDIYFFVKFAIEKRELL